MLRGLFVLLAIYSSYSAAGEYPVPSSVRTFVSSDGQKVGFDVEWTTVMLGDDTRYAPALNRSQTFIVFQDKRGSLQKVGQCSTDLCKVPGNSSKGELAMSFYNGGIRNKTSTFALKGYDGGCVGIGFGSIAEGQAGDGQIPNGGCITAPPLNVFCQVNTENIFISHGELSLGSGVNKASQNFTVNCISRTSVRFSFSNDNLTLSNNLVSKLSVSGGNNKVLSMGDNNLAVESEINVNASVRAGPASGATALTFSYD